jgi:hypothetical protein
MLGAEKLPTVDELLSVDREYRRRAVRGERIVHTTRDGRRWTALYSTTALARQFGRTSDWVVLDLEVAGPNPRWTVVTERRGVLKGKRVVRGREVECFRLYRARRERRRARVRSGRAGGDPARARDRSAEESPGGDDRHEHEHGEAVDAHRDAGD